MRRQALAVTEFVTGLVLVLAVGAPLAAGYWGASWGSRQAARSYQALMVARTVLDHVHYRLHNFGTNAAATHLAGHGTAHGTDFRQFFQSLAQPSDKKVATTVDTERSPQFLYFGSPSATGEWTGIRDSTSELFKRLEEFTCTVDVAQGEIDADLDGVPDRDSMEVAVTVRWTDEAGPREFRLSSVLCKAQCQAASDQ